MVDLSPFIIPKSDQLNADDLRDTGRCGGPITVRVTRVVGTNDKEQPIAIYFENDGGKPYKPGKSMRRVLINFWGKNGDDYVGKLLQLHCDPEVSFGKIKVGGIRIGGMSHIGDETEMALAVTKGAKRLFKVRRLSDEPRGNGGQGKRKMTPTEQADAFIAAINALGSLDELVEYQADERRVDWLGKFKVSDPVEWQRVVDAQSARAQALRPPDDDGGRSDEQHGDQHDGTDDDDDTFPGDE